MCTFANFFVYMFLKNVKKWTSLEQDVEVPFFGLWKSLFYRKQNQLLPPASWSLIWKRSVKAEAVGGEGLETGAGVPACEPCPRAWALQTLPSALRLSSWHERHRHGPVLIAQPKMAVSVVAFFSFFFFFIFFFFFLKFNPHSCFLL